MGAGFNQLLDVYFGPRKILCAIECPVCGSDEVYYMSQISGKQIGRACEDCNFVQRFDF